MGSQQRQGGQAEGAGVGVEVTAERQVSQGQEGQPKHGYRGPDAQRCPVPQSLRQQAERQQEQQGGLELGPEGDGEAHCSVSSQASLKRTWAMRRRCQV